MEVEKNNCHCGIRSAQAYQPNFKLGQDVWYIADGSLAHGLVVGVKLNEDNCSSSFPKYIYSVSSYSKMLDQSELFDSEVKALQKLASDLAFKVERVQSRLKELKAD